MIDRDLNSLHSTSNEPFLHAIRQTRHSSLVVTLIFETGLLLEEKQALNFLNGGSFHLVLIAHAVRAVQRDRARELVQLREAPTPLVSSSKFRHCNNRNSSPPPQLHTLKTKAELSIAARSTVFIFVPSNTPVYAGSLGTCHF